MSSLAVLENSKEESELTSEKQQIAVEWGHKQRNMSVYFIAGAQMGILGAWETVKRPLGCKRRQMVRVLCFALPMGF